MVGMSVDTLCSFVDLILQLPKSVQVLLCRCYIRQRTMDCRAYIRSHPRLTVDVDKDFANGVFTLKFHRNSEHVSQC